MVGVNLEVALDVFLVLPYCLDDLRKAKTALLLLLEVVLALEKVSADRFAGRPLVLQIHQLTLPSLLLRFLLFQDCIPNVDASCLLGFQDLLLLLHQVVVADLVTIHLYVGLPHDLAHRFRLLRLAYVVEAKSLLLINSANVFSHLLPLTHSLRSWLALIR